MTTVADVARRAGLSRSTVSYALSGKRPVSAATRVRIERAMAEVGYEPPADSSWQPRAARARMLGLLVQFHADEFTPVTCEYVLPITERARQLGCDVVMLTDRDGAGALGRVAREGTVDGVVLLDVVVDDPRVEALREGGLPGVLLGCHLPGPGEDDDAPAADGPGALSPSSPSSPSVDAVDLDFAAAARLLVDHLHALGHTTVLLVTPPAEVFERGASYAPRFRDAAERRARELGMRLTTHAGHSRQPEVNLFVQDLLDAHPLATALVVHNDATAAALPSILQQRGVMVPRDLSVVSLFSRQFSASFSVPFTAVDSEPATIGQHAVDRLLQRLRSAEEAGPTRLQLVAPSLVDRGSTAPPPWSGGRVS